MVCQAAGKDAVMGRVMRNLVPILFCSMSVILAQAPNSIGTQTQVIPLWDHGAPGALGDGPGDRPSITVYPLYPPAPTGRASGTAVIIAPGGGYQSLAITHEGVQVRTGLMPWE